MTKKLENIDEVIEEAVLRFPHLSVEELQELSVFLDRAYHAGCRDGQEDDWKYPR